MYADNTALCQGMNSKWFLRFRLLVCPCDFVPCRFKNWASMQEVSQVIFFDSAGN